MDPDRRRRVVLETWNTGYNRTVANEAFDMQQQISVVTLGIADLVRSRRFYREGFGHETLLPTPHTGLRLAHPPHDRSRADPIDGQQYDRRAPDMLLRRIAVSGQTLKAEAVRRRNFKYDPGAHGAESHGAIRKGIPNRTLVSGVIH